jgi:hypothetical protein
MSNRANRKSGNNRRPQGVKSENRDWMRARLDHSNRNNTIQSGKRYKRPAPGQKEF